MALPLPVHHPEVLFWSRLCTHLTESLRDHGIGVLIYQKGVKSRRLPRYPLRYLLPNGVFCISPMTTCPKCGNTNDVGSEYCARCHTHLPIVSAPPPVTSDAAGFHGQVLSERRQLRERLQHHLSGPHIPGTTVTLPPPAAATLNTPPPAPARDFSSSDGSSDIDDLIEQTRRKGLLAGQEASPAPAPHRLPSVHSSSPSPSSTAPSPRGVFPVTEPAPAPGDSLVPPPASSPPSRIHQGPSPRSSPAPPPVSASDGIDERLTAIELRLQQQEALIATLLEELRKPPSAGPSPPSPPSPPSSAPSPDCAPSPPPSPVARLPRPAWLLPVGGAVALLAGIALVQQMNSGTPPAQTPPPEPPPVQVALPPPPAPETPPPPPPPSPPPGMVLIPGGEYRIGSRQDIYSTPEHTVRLDPFWIDATEVTQDEYARFVAATGEPPPPHWGGRPTPPPGTGNLPVTQITLAEAERYARWAGKALPTEIEWEAAARGASVSAAGKPRGRCLPATEGTPQGDFALLHILGNVWEWTASPAQPYPNSPAVLPEGQQVIRGGGFRDRPSRLQPWFRNWVPPTTRSDQLGFRCVWRPSPPTVPTRTAPGGMPVSGPPSTVLPADNPRPGSPSPPPAASPERPAERAVPPG